MANVAPIPPPLERPVLANPLIVKLTTGSDAPKLQDDRDYILVMPGTVKKGNTTIRGGRNVIIAGGYASIGAGLDQACFSIKDGAPGRTVHIEGVRIDAKQGGQSDGFQLGCPNTHVQLHRISVSGLRGALNQRHADCVQCLAMKSLHLESCSLRSHYNNLYMRRENDPLGSPMGPVTLNRVNCGGYNSNPLGAPQQTLRAISLGTQPIPPSDPTSNVNCELSGAVWLYEFYGNAAEAGKDLSDFVWPHAGSRMTNLCRAEVDVDGTSIDWPYWRTDDPTALGVCGVVKLGPPAGGDYCPATSVGAKYPQALRS